MLIFSFCRVTVFLGGWARSKIYSKLFLIIWSLVWVDFHVFPKALFLFMIRSLAEWKRDKWPFKQEWFQLINQTFSFDPRVIFLQFRE